MSEKILTFKSNLLQNKYDSLLFEHVYGDEEIAAFMNRNAIHDWEWQDRKNVEQNENYRQPIVYTIFRKHPEVFTYQRKGSEQRLTSQLSIGLGGHVNPEDGNIDNKYEILATLKQSAMREIFEEVDFIQMKNGTKLPINDAWYKLNLQLELRALFCTREPSNKIIVPVGNVHLAVVAEVKIPYSVQDILINEGTSLGFQSTKDLKVASNIFSDNIESWSQIVLEHLF